MSTDDSKPVDLSKPVQTRNGWEVVIYTTEGSNPELPVVGEYRNSHGGWNLFSRRLNGKIWIETDDDFDLVNVPQQHTVTINVYRRSTEQYYEVPVKFMIHKDRAEADGHATSNRIACFEHTFSEGEGIE